MKRLLIAMVGCALLMGALPGCEEAEANTESTPEPEPVEPVEISADEEDSSEESEELETLRARVAELEEQLSSCQAGSTEPEPVEGGTQTASAEGAEGAEGEGEAAEGEGEEGGTSQNRRGRRDIVDDVLGSRRGRNTITLPNPF